MILKNEYKINRKKIKEGLEELIKFRANQIVYNGLWPQDIRESLENYGEVEKIANGEFDIDTSKYNAKVKKYLEQNKGPRGIKIRAHHHR